MSAYGQQCCGDQVVDDDMVCCDDVTGGIAYTADVNKGCCGQEYVTYATTECCIDETGRGKVRGWIVDGYILLISVLVFVYCLHHTIVKLN